MVSGSGLHGGIIDGAGWGILTATLKLCHHNLLQIGKMGIIHFSQCGASVISGSNHCVYNANLTRSIQLIHGQGDTR